MWVEAILTREDLAKALDDLCPLRILVGEDGSVIVSEPRAIELVPGVGLRVTANAEIHWPILGIAVPITVRSMTLDVRPLILKSEGGDKLAFRLQLDQVDISLLPSFLDQTVVDRVNQELEAKHIELAWNFSETLSHVFALPPSLASAGAIELKVAWGEAKTTLETLVLAISFHASVLPRGPLPEDKRAGSVAATRPGASLEKVPRTRRPDRGSGDAILLGATAACASFSLWAIAQSIRST
jgi:hypothetical protein